MLADRRLAVFRHKGYRQGVAGLIWVEPTAGTLVRWATVEAERLRA